MRGKLTVKKIQDETTFSEWTHNEINSSDCVLLEAVEGKAAWFAVHIPDDELVPWHRIQTSPVTKIENPNDYEMIIWTENSVYRICREQFSS